MSQMNFLGLTKLVLLRNIFYNKLKKGDGLRSSPDRALIERALLLYRTLGNLGVSWSLQSRKSWSFCCSQHKGVVKSASRTSQTSQTSQPVSQSGSQPVSQPASPASQPASQSASQPASQPANQSVSQPASQPSQPASPKSRPKSRPEESPEESNEICRNALFGVKNNLHVAPNLLFPSRRRHPNIRKNSKNVNQKIGFGISLGGPGISFWNFVGELGNFVLEFRWDSPKFRFGISLGGPAISFWNFVGGTRNFVLEFRWGAQKIRFGISLGLSKVSLWHFVVGTINFVLEFRRGARTIRF